MIKIARVICRPSPWPATPARHHQPAPPAKSTPNAPRRAGINAAALAMARITRAITPIKTAIAARQLDAHGLTNSPKIGEMIGYIHGPILNACSLNAAVFTPSVDPIAPFHK
ncbi:hypothetical protein FB451DRAFT_1413762 [Mycena latifolia]|nr:hypothetical protein FB451DRAFT_1413762 [Mycena latifolia]